MNSNFSVPDFINPEYIKTNNEHLKDLGKMIKRYRKYNHLTQAQLAERTGLSKDQISRIEVTGKTSTASLVIIMRQLNILNDMVQLTQKEPPKSLFKNKR